MMKVLFLDLSLSSWLITIATFLFLYLWLNRSQWKLPPGPPRLPLVGTLPFMVGYIREVFGRLAAKYGDMFTLYFGNERAVVINGYDLIKACLTKTGGVFDGRPYKLWQELNYSHGKIKLYIICYIMYNSINTRSLMNMEEQIPLYNILQIPLYIIETCKIRAPLDMPNTRTTRQSDLF